MEKQQNDKSTQVLSRKLWIRSLAVTATMAKVCKKAQQLQKTIEYSHYNVLAKVLYELDLDQHAVKSVKGQKK